MKRMARGCFFVIILFTSAISVASGLSEDSVNELLERVDNAAVNLNAEEISNALSNNVQITINISSQGKTQVLKLSKQEYIDMLKQGWSMYKNYKYSKSNVKINIQGSAAYVSADIKESMTVQGQDISGNSKEDLTIELVNGRVLITSVVAYATM